jgi:hypothetical protein
VSDNLDVVAVLVVVFGALAWLALKAIKGWREW